jgi:hypothetical protein
MDTCTRQVSVLADLQVSQKLSFDEAIAAMEVTRKQQSEVDSKTDASILLLQQGMKEMREHIAQLQAGVAPK